MDAMKDVVVKRKSDSFRASELETSGDLFVSVVIPVLNASHDLKRCLDSITKSSYSHFEVIVVDDGSTDDSAETARREGARVFQMAERSGPGAARNRGAQHAGGDILFFVDSDVLIQKDSMARVVDDFNRNPGIAAVFGSYDDSPDKPNFLSQYKNLSHHFVHQQGSEDAVTFWAGCGAVRREAFLSVGGFDQKRYPYPSIEDIELGSRMKKQGYQILLDKKLQAKHLKNWQLKSLVGTEIRHRAIPWSKLLLENGKVDNNLNLQTEHRISALLVGVMVLLAPFLFFMPKLLIVMAILCVSVFLLNYEYFKFFYRRRGFWFALGVFPLHLFYYLYSSCCFAACIVGRAFSKKRPSVGSVSR